MADESRLRLVLRGHTIAAEAAMTDAGGELFVSMAKPPPVGSILEAFDGDQRQILEVARVVETEAGDRARGFFGRIGDDDGRLSKVGSEHLADGAPGPAPDVSTQEEEAASSYPVPAPVLEAEPSAPIDLGHPADPEQQMAAAQAESEQASAAEMGEHAAAAEGDDDEGADQAPEGDDKPKGRGKKRKGRKRG